MEIISRGQLLVELAKNKTCVSSSREGLNSNNNNNTFSNLQNLDNSASFVEGLDSDEYQSDEDIFGNDDTDNDSDYIPNSQDESSNSEKEEMTAVDDSPMVVDNTVEAARDAIVEDNQVKKKKIFPVKEKKSRLRKRQPNIWKRKKACISRERGLEYVSQKGVTVKEKTVNLGFLCKDTCKLKCNNKFNDEQRQNIFSGFYKLDINTKNMLLFKSIVKFDVKRQRKGALKHKRASFNYVISLDGKQHMVCKTAFCSLYQIGRKKIDIIRNKILEGFPFPPKDRRGCHNSRPHKLEESVHDYVVLHIKEFPADQSHYSRTANPHKMYLSPILSVSKMHKLYLEKCDANDLPSKFKVKLCTYRNIFSNEFNLSFGSPRSDTCSKCDKGESDELHRETYEAAFEQQKVDKFKANKNSKVVYLTMDLQQTFPLPKLTTSRAFYLRQLWFYNLGFHLVYDDKIKATFLTWTEDVASRGSAEISSSLLTYLETEGSLQEKNHLIIWTDSCGGQNKNFLMICLYQYLILKGIFRVIDHKFPEVGHSYLDCDRDFDRIEKVLRKHECIYTPDKYRQIISEASKKHYVVDMRQHFRDMTKLAGQLNIMNRKKNVLQEKVPFRDGIRWLRVDEYGSYLYKESFDEFLPIKKVNLIKNKGKEINANNITINRITHKTGEVSKKKKENLKEQLCYIPEQFQWFYNDIVQ